MALHEPRIKMVSPEEGLPAFSMLSGDIFGS